MWTIDNADLWLKVVAEQVVLDFLNPAGYDVTIPPIRYGLPCEDLPCPAGAVTNYGRRVGTPVEEIIVASFNMLEMARNPPHRDAATLAHELIHVAISPRYVDRDDHLEPAFVDLANKMGLKGDMHATYEGPRFMKWLEDRVLPVYEAARVG